MRPRWFPTLSLALLAVVAACAEPAGLDESSSAPRRWRLQPLLSSYVEEGPQEPPPEAPEGYNWYTKLDVSAYAWWETGPDDEGSPVTAWAEGFASYTGTDATVLIKLDILKNGQLVDRALEGMNEVEHIWPVESGLSAFTSRPVSDRCDLIAAAQAVGGVWNKFLVNWNWVKWGSKKKSKGAESRQPACNPSGGGGGGELQKTDYGSYADNSAPFEWECHYADTWHSKDGGETWSYGWREYTGCHVIA